MNVKRLFAIEEVLSELQNRETKILAGGTDILVKKYHQPDADWNLIDISAVKELQGISYQGDLLRIGALATFDEIERFTAGSEAFAALHDAAGSIGSPQIRHRGTIGGNIITGSPAADGSVALLCLDAVVELQSADGVRVVPLDGFFEKPGKTRINADELLISVLVPPSDGKSNFIKIGKRNAMAISVVNMAFWVDKAHGAPDNARLSIGAVAPVPLRLKQTEAYLRGANQPAPDVEAACAILQSEICPIDDLRASAGYRRTVAANCLSNWIQETWGRK